MSILLKECACMTKIEELIGGKISSELKQDVKKYCHYYVNVCRDRELRPDPRHRNYEKVFNELGEKLSVHEELRHVIGRFHFATCKDNFPDWYL